MSVKILGKIEEMGNRIDDLENSINVLVDQAGMTDLNSSISSFHHQHHHDSSTTTANTNSSAFQEINNNHHHHG
jgi:hypothetical protein